MKLADAVGRLREVLLEARLPLDLAGASEALTTRAEALDQMDDYLMPRLARLDAPLLAVVGGSTGAGKSTIVNSLVGAEVSPPGVLRPTTRAPVLACHPTDLAWFEGGGVLPGLPRTHGTGASEGLQLVSTERLPAGMGLLDSPDIDSVEIAHHELAAQLLGAADLWLFVTTAARYADAVPWRYLARAQERSAALAVVVNRIPAGAAVEIRAHLAAMLDERGLRDVDLFAVGEAELVDGRIGAGLDPLRRWLNELVADADTRRDVARRTLEGVLSSYLARCERLAAAVERQAEAAEVLRANAAEHYVAAARSIDADLGSGVVLRGEVLERFREHIGTAVWMDRLQQGLGRVRDRARAALTGQALPEEGARGAIEWNLVTMIRHAADSAALDVVADWRALPGGAQLLERSPPQEVRLDRSSPDLPERAAAEVEAWQRGVFDLVRERAGSKLAAARGLSLGINSMGVALMTLVFASTGGLTGGEIAIAGGTAAVSHTLLGALFGDQAVRDLAKAARRDLRVRTRRLLDGERARFDRVVEVVPDRAVAERLKQSAAALESAR